MSGSFKNGIFSCSFKRTKSESKRVRRATDSSLFDLEKDWHLMFGFGTAVTGMFGNNCVLNYLGKCPTSLSS